MGISLISGKNKDQNEFKTFKQGSEYTDKQPVQLNLAIKYSFATKLMIQNSKLQLVQNSFQGL